MTDYQNTLKNIYEKAIERPNGFKWEYHGYTFQKYRHDIESHHSGVVLYNPDGNKVESYTIAAFDSFEDFASSVQELVEYGPDSVEDWLNRDK